MANSRLYARQVTGLADRHFIQAEQAERKAHECPRCKAIADAIPQEVQLRSLLVDDFDFENGSASFRVRRLLRSRPQALRSPTGWRCSSRLMAL